MVQGLQATPTHGSLDLVEGALFCNQHPQRLAIQLVVGFQLADRDAGLAGHGQGLGCAGNTTRAAARGLDTPIWGLSTGNMVARGRVRVSRSRLVAIQVPLPKATPLALVLLVCGLVGCDRFPDRRLEQRKAAAEQQLRLDQAQCRRDRQQLPPLIETLRRSEERIAAIQAEGYAASSPPAPLDPEEQRRLALYDQEVEQEQYEQAYAAWQEREGQRRAAWRRDRQERLALARGRRADAAAALKAKAPALLRSTDPPLLNQAEADRRLACGARPR